MSNYSLYVDPVNGANTNAGTLASPLKDLSYALNTKQAFASGDLVLIQILAPLTAFDASVDLSQAKHGGVGITIRSGNGNPILINRGMDVPTSFIFYESGISSNISLNVDDVIIQDSIGWFGGFAQGNDTPATTLSLTNCQVQVTGSAPNVNSRVFGFGAGAQNVNISCSNCNFSNCGAFFDGPWFGNLSVQNTSYVSNITNGFGKQTFYLTRYLSLNVSNSIITRTDANAAGLLTANPRDCSSIVFVNNTIDLTGMTAGYNGGAIDIENFDPATALTTICNVVFQNNTIKVNNLNGRVLVLGQEDTGALSREAQRATINNRWGQVVVSGNTLINTSGAGGSGSLFGLGTDGLNRNYKPFILGNYFSLSAVDGTAYGHGVLLSGDNILFMDNVSVGFLGCVVFGNNITVQHNTINVYASGILTGHTGGGAWSYSQGAIITDNIVQCNATEINGVYNSGIADYSWNEDTSIQTNMFDRNMVYSVNGCAPFIINNTKCFSISQLQAEWVNYGTHPSNDANSIIANPLFLNTALQTIAGYQPTSVMALKTDGSYFGAIHPNPQAYPVMIGYDLSSQADVFFAYDQTGKVYRTDMNVYESFNNSNYANYQIAAIEQGSSGRYVMPPPNSLAVRYDLRPSYIGGNPSQYSPVYEDFLSVTSSGSGGSTPGYIGITQDTGGSGNLTIESGGVALSGALIQVFLKSTYDATPTTAPVLGWTTSDGNGNWVNPVYVPPGQTYAVVVSAVGNNSLETAVTV